MNSQAGIEQSHEIFVHIRIIVGMILGLSITRLVSGVTRFIQHPREGKIDVIHFGWVIVIFLSIIHFWWFEFALSRITYWTFENYLILICYSGIFAMLSSIIFPDNVGDHKKLEQYFRERKNLFYGLMLMLLLIDVLDTLIKGDSYYKATYGWYYPVRQGVLICGTVGAIFSKSERYQVLFVAFALVFQIVWIASLFDVLGPR